MDSGGKSIGECTYRGKGNDNGRRVVIKTGISLWEYLVCYRYGSRLSGMKAKVWVPRGASNLMVVLESGDFALDEVGVNGYFNSTKHSFIAGMMTTFAKGDNIFGTPKVGFRVEGCVEDENGGNLYRGCDLS